MPNFDGTLNPAAGWPDVPQLAPECVALGGAGGPMNAQAQALAARTAQLKAAVDALQRAGGGSQLLHGETAPAPELGVEGSLYINTAVGDLYTKSADGWGEPTSLVGPRGADGAPGAPGESTGGEPAPDIVGFANCAVFDYRLPPEQNWAIPAGVTKLVLEMWGAGGGGGAPGSGMGAGGAGGNYARLLLTNLPPSLNVTWGLGGNGENVNAGTPSSNGADSVVVFSTGGSVRVKGGQRAQGNSRGRRSDGEVTVTGAPTVSIQALVKAAGSSGQLPLNAATAGDGGNSFGFAGGIGEEAGVPWSNGAAALAGGGGGGGALAGGGGGGLVLVWY